LPSACFRFSDETSAPNSACAPTTGSRATAAATFEGEFADVTTGYAGKGMVCYQW
jgi:hypothetical protein